MTTDLDTPVPFTKRHGFLLLSHDRKLDEHDRKLDEHGRKLDEHGRKLDDHGRKLDDHGRKLDDHGRKLDLHSEELRRLGILMEDNTKDTKLILDIVLNTQSRLARFDHLDERVTSHDHRIAALEAFTRSDAK
jgi:hypothetical protein